MFVPVKLLSVANVNIDGWSPLPAAESLASYDSKRGGERERDEREGERERERERERDQERRGEDVVNRL